MMSATGHLIMFLLDVYFWIIIIQVALSWLIAFNVVNTSNPAARNFIDLLNKLTDPVFKPLRKYIPSIGGIDITPIIVIFGIFLLKNLVAGLFLRGAFYL